MNKEKEVDPFIHFFLGLILFPSYLLSYVSDTIKIILLISILGFSSISVLTAVRSDGYKEAIFSFIPGVFLGFIVFLFLRYYLTTVS